MGWACEILYVIVYPFERSLVIGIFLHKFHLAVVAELIISTEYGIRAESECHTGVEPERRNQLALVLAARRSGVRVIIVVRIIGVTCVLPVLFQHDCGRSLDGCADSNPLWRNENRSELAIDSSAAGAVMVSVSEVIEVGLRCAAVSVVELDFEAWRVHGSFLEVGVHAVVDGLKAHIRSDEQFVWEV